MTTLGAWTGGAFLFDKPRGVALDGVGNVYVADYSQKIWKGFPAAFSALETFSPGLNAGQFEFSLTAPLDRSVVVEAKGLLAACMPDWVKRELGRPEGDRLVRQFCGDDPELLGDGWDQTRASAAFDFLNDYLREIFRQTATQHEVPPRVNLAWLACPKTPSSVDSVPHFVYRADAGQHAESQSVLRINGRAGVPAFDGTLTGDQNQG